MFNIPENATPEFEAFVTGLFLPFFSAALGYAIAVVRKIIENFNHHD